MSSAVILQHSPHAGPGRLVPIFRDFGIPTDVRRLYAGDEVPTDLDEIRVIVVLGGCAIGSDAAISANDIDSDKFPFLATEYEVLKRMITVDRPVLGIGLGAQLIAHAAGAKVYPNVKPGATPEDPKTPLPEFGWGGVTFPFPGGTEPILMGLMDGAPMFHWHTETFDLPALPAPANAAPPPAPRPPTGNALMSSTRTCKNQAFRFKNRIFGFQYHFELTEADINALLDANKDALNTLVGTDADKKIREETAVNFARYERLGNRILRNYVQFLKMY